MTEETNRFSGSPNGLPGGGEAGSGQGAPGGVGGGRNLLDAMDSKFVVNVPAGLPMGQSDMFQNATVKRVRKNRMAGCILRY